VLGVEDWAGIRRFYRSERVSISEIARPLGISRNTVKAALRTEIRTVLVAVVGGSV
jgi:predicted DNA binding protein